MCHDVVRFDQGGFQVRIAAISDVHGNLFGLTHAQLSAMHYCGMGLTKLTVGLLFFIPWVSIRMVLRQRRTG